MKNVTLKIFLLAIFGVSNVYAFQNTETEPIVWKVSFDGNEQYRNMVLNQLIATSKPSLSQKLFGNYSEYVVSEMDLRRDVVRIERFYHRRGFHNASVEYEITDRSKSWQKEVVFNIREGMPIRIRSTQVIINAENSDAENIREKRDFQRALNRHDYREGRRYEMIRQPDVEGMFRITLENCGYAWPEVDISAEVDSVANRADITITLTPNSATFFTGFDIQGDISVPERIVTRQTNIKPGDPYSRRQIQSAQRSIFNHHLFRFATITLPEQEKDSTLSALIRVREYEPRTVEAAVGVGREEILRGQVNWQHRNINGSGHRFGTNVRASFIEQWLGFNYLIPYTINAKSSNASSLFGVHRLEPSYELFQAGINTSLIYQFERNKTASISYAYSLNEELSRDQGAQLPSFFSNYNVSSITLSAYYSEGFSRDQRGWVIRPFIEFSGTFGESTFSFQKFNIDVRRFTPLTRSTTLAARVNGGTIFYAQDDNLPSNIRFFTGGTNSVRGWNRQRLGPSAPIFDEDGNFTEFVPVGGRSLLSFNIELRQDLDSIIPNIGIAAFLDGGQVWRNLSSLDERPVQYGAGGGLRYQSPIGPVRIDVAYKLNPTDEDLNIFEGVDYGSASDRIGIHFSIGQAF